MKRIAILISGLFLLIGTSANAQINTVPEYSAGQIDSLSYLLGFNFGYFIKANKFPNIVDFARMEKAMHDVLNTTVDANDPTFEDQFEIAPSYMNQVFDEVINKQMQIVVSANKAKGAEFLAKNKKEKGVVETASGLQYRIIEKGNEVKPSESSNVMVKYTGKTLDGKVFDSTDTPISLNLGRVIDGWKEGMQLIGEGGKMTLWIPSDLAYGDRGAGSDIGPGELIIFDIELAAVGFDD